jgi:tRNA threonylcarbamoyl adenosine modification protein YeaZ
MLAEQSLRIADIDLFAATAGPGSFTGLRIGIAAIKGFALMADKPCAAVPTLLSAAMGVELSGVICAAVKARPNEYYCAFFERAGGRLARLSEDAVMSGEQIIEQAREFEGVVRLCGEGSTELLKTAPDSLFVDTGVQQSAANSAAGKAFDDAMALWSADTSQKWDEWNANESLRQYGNSEWWKGEQWEYGKERDAMSDSRELAITLISRGIAVPSDIAASSGLSDNAITALQEAYQKTTAAGGTSVNDLTKISDTTLDLLENFGVETATAYASMMVANGYIDETQLPDILDLANSSINGGEYPDGADVTVEGYGETTPETQQKTEAEEEEEEKQKKNPATTGGGGGTSIKATHKSD